MEQQEKVNLSKQIIEDIEDFPCKGSSENINSTKLIAYLWEKYVEIPNSSLINP